MQEWTGEQVWKKLQEGGKTRIVDVREPFEYSSGHIPGAELIPMGQIPSSLNRFDRDEEVVVVCRSGGRSSQVCQYLRASGFDKVINMDGGMMYWPGDVERG